MANKLKSLGINPMLFAVMAVFVLGAAGVVQATLLNNPPDKIPTPMVISEESPTNEQQQAFDERQNVTLEKDLRCSNTTIPAGESVNSHMIFFNSRSTSVEVDANRTWGFAGEILCVMTEGSGLLQGESDHIFKIDPDQTYFGPFDGRGLETDGSDSIAFSSSTLTLTMTSGVSGGDWIRVITRPSIPEDETTPTVFCEKGTSPGGKEQKDNGKDPSDGHFFKLVGTDETDGLVDITITDTVSGTEFGPYVNGTNIQILTAKGARPGESTGSGAIEFKLKVNGPTTISATDAAGNIGENVCSN